MLNLDSQFLNIIEKYKKIENSLNNLESTNSENLIKLNREYADLKPIVDKIEEYRKEQNEILNLNELLKDNDQDISKIAEIELVEKKNIIKTLENALLKVIIPK